MTEITLTVWNIQEFDEALNGQSLAARGRQEAIAAQIRAMDPDILCVVEASRDLPAMRRFVRQHLSDEYDIPVLPGTEEALRLADEAEKWRALSRLYRLPNRRKSASGPAAQWIWFLVRRRLDAAPTLVPPVVFSDFARRQFLDRDDRERTDGRWTVHWWQEEKPTAHRHDRHPQVVRLTLAGRPVEIIGAHLKSKLNKATPEFVDGHLTGEFLRVALSARGKLATEAVHIRN